MRPTADDDLVLRISPATGADSGREATAADRAMGHETDRDPLPTEQNVGPMLPS
jgi:hypothetical protein